MPTKPATAHDDVLPHTLPCLPPTLLPVVSMSACQHVSTTDLSSSIESSRDQTRKALSNHLSSNTATRKLSLTLLDSDTNDAGKACISLPDRLTAQMGGLRNQCKPRLDFVPFVLRIKFSTRPAHQICTTIRTPLPYKLPSTGKPEGEDQNPGRSTSMLVHPES